MGLAGGWDPMSCVSSLRLGSPPRLGEPFALPNLFPRYICLSSNYLARVLPIDAVFNCFAIKAFTPSRTRNLTEKLQKRSSPPLYNPCSPFAPI
uniref:Uncharacterized protein n=1 Tax=Nelumbo nucifera TaxID=4432 RepID=A0A822YLU9_NELNU|nr:TPA_asm: hypothetical protein HUJ06_012353 [Nelumbo nucifera]